MKKTRAELRALNLAESDLPEDALAINESVIKEIEKGEKTLRRKIEKQEKIESLLAYQSVKRGVWFKEVVDPIIGFIIPGVGDLIGAALSLPALYVALFYVKSFPLVLAILYYNLMDLMISSVPIIGDIIDFFYHSHRRSANVLVGYVEGDEYVKGEVRRKAVWMGIGILVLCFIIYWLLKGVIGGMTWIAEQIGGLFG